MLRPHSIIICASRNSQYCVESAVSAGMGVKLIKNDFERSRMGLWQILKRLFSVSEQWSIYIVNQENKPEP